MKTLEISEARASLGEYAREVGKEALIVTDSGKPVVALVPIEGADLENLSLTANPRFWAILEASKEQLRREGGIPFDQVCRNLGVTEADLEAAKKELPPDNE